MGSPIDLRSDTVTVPCDAMRQAMATADVGDDVYGEDPTVNRLQSRVAELLGKEASLYVPSGSMANQIAIVVHTRPGDEIIVGNKAHTWLYESGGAAAIAGVQVRVIDGDGRYTAAKCAEHINPGDDHYARTSAVLVENTHNMGGGTCWQRSELDAVIELAKTRAFRLHLDGARLWNASVSTASSLASLASGFDSVSVCLSKGLGAPVGSLLAGTKDFIVEAHRVRKRLGGGMRQAGIIAAAGLFAIENNIASLETDHQNARFLAESLNGVGPFRINMDSIQTNIVMVDLPSNPATNAVTSETDGSIPTAAQMVARGLEHDLLFGKITPTRFRLVTHRNVDRAMCERTVETLVTIGGLEAR